MWAKIIFAIVALFAVAEAAPTPTWWGGHHKHYVIHVPYHVHTVHHHEPPIIKHVPIIKEVHVPVYKHVHYGHGWDNGWW